jgi:hypothetical protein
MSKILHQQAFETFSQIGRNVKHWNDDRNHRFVRGAGDGTQVGLPLGWPES